MRAVRDFDASPTANATIDFGFCEQEIVLKSDGVLVLTAEWNTVTAVTGASDGLLLNADP